MKSNRKKGNRRNIWILNWQLAMNGDDDSGENKKKQIRHTHKLQTLIQTVVYLLLFLLIFLSLRQYLKYHLSRALNDREDSITHNSQFVFNISFPMIRLHSISSIFLHFVVDFINRNDIQYTAYNDRLYLT